MKKLNEVKSILYKYNQEHLLAFYDEISEEQQEMLLNQILSIDFEKMKRLYNNSKINSISGEISPLEAFDKNAFSITDIDFYETIGADTVKNNEFAVVTLAGGQGTRLGHAGPKGTLELNLAPKKKSLFEILCDGLKIANAKYDVTIPWYIMTSETNHTPTISFFEENNYFNYPKEYVQFFPQDKLPILDINGNLLLNEMHSVLEGSNGNGNVYSALLKNNMINDMKSKNCKWVFICGIDNVLVKVVDPFFLGLTINKSFSIASKSVSKEDSDVNVSAFCRRDGRPSMLMPEELTHKFHTAQNESGNYLYRDANALCHLLSIDALEKASKLDLPYHRAFKKNTFVNAEGMKQIPEHKNSFKFEQFIFDAFAHFDDMLLLRVEKSKEFAPIKDLIGMNTATKLHIKANKK